MRWSLVALTAFLLTDAIVRDRAANETLPTDPIYPADLFTACLTTPLKIALRWFASRSMLTKVTPDMIDKIPGKIGDRKTPLGELNW